MLESELAIDNTEMKLFIKKGIKSKYISKKPKKQQLYYLYKLILNRRSFTYRWAETLLLWSRKLFCCCSKKCIEKRCKKSFKTAEKKEKFFKKGKDNLKNDLDIVRLVSSIQNQSVIN